MVQMEETQGTLLVLDDTTHDNISRLLEGEIDLQQFSGLHDLGGGKLRDPAGFIEGQARLLHIFNLTYKIAQHERVIHRAFEHLGQPGLILHIPAEDPTLTYTQAVIQRGRLLTPVEYGTMLTSTAGLDILFKQAVQREDLDTVRAIIDRARDLVPHKALVLAHLYGFTYDQVLDEFMRTSDSVELVGPDAFVDFVAMHVAELDARGECGLQLTRDLSTLDNLLSMAEYQRTPETRMAMVKDIMATAPKYHFVHENNLRSKAFYEAYTDHFEVEDMARSTIKWKCDGECMGCTNWKKTLSKAGPHYGHM